MAYVIKDAQGNPIKHDGIEVFMNILGNCVKGVDMNTRQLSMIGSDETVDRDGDICVVNGWDLANFQKNPVFLWSHQYSGPESVPLARAIKVMKKRNPAALTFTMQFPTEGVNPFADMILNLYNEKIINASSVGFIPREWEPADPNADNAESMWYGGGRKFLKCELLELSGCAVPCNPAALANAIKGYVHPQTQADIQAKVVNWLMGKSAIDAKLIGIDEVELRGELQDLECKIEEETPTMVQVIDQIVATPTEKVASQGVDNTEEKDYNITNVDNPPKEEENMTVKYNYSGIEAVKITNESPSFFKSVVAENGEVSFEPIDLETLKGELEVEGKVALVFGQNYTLVEPKEFIELLGVTSAEVATPTTTETPVKAPEGEDIAHEEVPALDTTKLLDSLKALSAILPEVK
jgi:hypothetical protein